VSKKNAVLEKGMCGFCGVGLGIEKRRRKRLLWW